MDRPYVAENNRERARLRALVERLSDGDLARPLDAGWTVGAVLAHLAFWDERILVLIERWEKEGLRSTPRSFDEKDVDWINDSTKALCLALPPREAARLAVAAAGNPISLVRAEHRREHLDEIERVFAPSRSR